MGARPCGGVKSRRAWETMLKKERQWGVKNQPYDREGDHMEARPRAAQLAVHLIDGSPPYWELDAF